MTTWREGIREYEREKEQEDKRERQEKVKRGGGGQAAPFILGQVTVGGTYPAIAVEVESRQNTRGLERYPT